MAKLEWDQNTAKLYETGIDRVVLYKMIKEGAGIGTYGEGKAWNGFTGLTESPSGAEETALYANNDKYLSMYSKEEFAGTLKAYTYPVEWEECDGSAEIATGVKAAQQARTMFALTYRTLIGNDVEGNNYDYKIHLVYGATASPSSKDYQTINDTPEAIEFSWDFKTVPVEVKNYQKTSHITIQKTKVTSAQLTAIENALYGTESSEPRILMPDELIGIITGNPSGETGQTGSTSSTGN